MKKNLRLFLLTIISILNIGEAKSQQPSGYFELFQKGTKCYYDKDYVNAGKFLGAAADLTEYKPGGPDGFIAAYNSACSWSLANDPGKAFQQLSKVAKKLFFVPYYEQMLSDQDFKNLYKDSRWQKICNRVKRRKERYESNLNHDLVKLLDSIRQNDQTDRLKALGYEKKYGGQSTEAKEEWKIVEEKDEQDLSIIKLMIRNTHWPGPKEVGFEGNETIFLVIQHADIKTQEMYLPIMHKAVIKGNALPKDYAYLVDRVALREGKKQIYGSQLVRDGKTGQMLYPAPLSDPDQVDIRREQVGLEPMANYLKENGLEWNIGKYKAMLTEKESDGKKD